MKINVTASGNFNNKKTWSGVKKHMEHDLNLNHKNKYLNTEESKRLRQFNRHENLINFDDFTKEKFQPYISEHDTNEKHKNKKYNSVDEFLEQKSRIGKSGKTYPVQLFVEKFSDMETFSNVYKQTNNNLKNATINGRPLTDNERDFYANKIFADGLTEYAQGFNRRNPNLKMFEYYIHMDEKGAPHLHAPVMPYTDMGRTNKGLLKQPSTSLNRALSEQYRTNSKLKTNKQRLSEFRRQEDFTLVSCVNDTYEKIFHERPFELVRKTDEKQVETGINHDEYVAKQKAKEHDKQLKLSISNNEKVLNNQKSSITENQELLLKQQKTLKEQEKAKTFNQLKIDEQEKTKKSNQVKLNEQEKEISTNQTRLEILRTNEQKLINSFHENSKKIKKYFSKITVAIVKRIKAMGYAKYDNLQENQEMVNNVKDIPDILRDTADSIEDSVTMVDEYNHKMNDYIRTASEAQKTSSKPLIKETSENTHVTEKDDDLEL